MRQVGEDFRQQPLRVLSLERLAIDLRHDLEGRRLARLQGGANPPQALVRELAIAADVRVHVAEGAPMSGQAQARAEALDAVQRAQEFTHGIRRVAVLEVQRDPP